MGLLRTYGYDMVRLLIVVWMLAGQPSGKYLAATMAIWLPKLIEYGEFCRTLTVTDSLRSQYGTVFAGSSCYIATGAVEYRVRVRGQPAILMMQRVRIAPLGRHAATDQGHNGPHTSMRAGSAFDLTSCGAPKRVRQNAMSNT